MTDLPQTTPNNNTQQCHECGQPFSCGVADEVCWCMQEAWLMPVPKSATTTTATKHNALKQSDESAQCLCPSCLQAKIAHTKKMQATKAKMRTEQKTKTKKHGLVIVLTGNGKGKSTSAFGNALRAIGHGYNVAIVQFIKGKWQTGESTFMKNLAKTNMRQVHYAAMETGFTWDTQDKTADIQAAETAWTSAQNALQDASIKLVVLDEMTYMLNYGYLDKVTVFTALRNRPAMQTVIITGRDADEELIALADTVSDLQEVKHAYNAGVRAQKGVDY